MTGVDVAAVIERLVMERGAPDRIQCDNGSEFISRALDKWAYENGVTMDFSRPGKPMDNAMIESFNGTFRDECLNVNWFLSMEDSREKIEKWRKDYNEFRPHSSLGDLTPQQFLDKFSTRIKGQKTPLLAGPVFGCGATKYFSNLKNGPNQGASPSSRFYSLCLDRFKGGRSPFRDRNVSISEKLIRMPTINL